MNDNRYQQGLEIMSHLAGEQGLQALDRMHAFSPDFAHFLAESFGELYSRPVLSVQQREFITLSALITQGASENQLQFHFHAALKIGLTVAELIEIIIHCTGYAGFPRALNAFQILQRIVDVPSQS